MNVITEGVAGTYHYHLSEKGRFTSLCGVQVMGTSIKEWGYVGHLREKWCQECWDSEHREGLKVRP